MILKDVTCRAAPKLNKHFMTLCPLKIRFRHRHLIFFIRRSLRLLRIERRWLVNKNADPGYRHKAACRITWGQL